MTGFPRPGVLFERVQPEGPGAPWTVAKVGPVIVHGFGLDTCDIGEGTYSVAIVEAHDGTLQTFPVELVQFDPPTDQANLYRGEDDPRAVLDDIRDLLRQIADMTWNRT